MADGRSEDFKKHFGPVFSSRASFAITGDTNPNFWKKNRLKNVLDGISDTSIGNVIQKRPYYSDDDFYKKNPGAKKIRKMDYFPFDVSEILLIENVTRLTTQNFCQRIPKFLSIVN